MVVGCWGMARGWAGYHDRIDKASRGGWRRGGRRRGGEWRGFRTTCKPRHQGGGCCFGHIHSYKDIRNSGTRNMHGLRTIFSNGSCVDDGKWGVITSHGNVLDV